jgi:hypothetical protein
MSGCWVLEDPAFLTADRETMIDLYGTAIQYVLFGGPPAYALIQGSARTISSAGVAHRDM